jgi:hypothetical protein
MVAYEVWDDTIFSRSYTTPPTSLPIFFFPPSLFHRRRLLLSLFLLLFLTLSRRLPKPMFHPLATSDLNNKDSRDMTIAARHALI